MRNFIFYLLMLFAFSFASCENGGNDVEIPDDPQTEEPSDKPIDDNNDDAQKPGDDNDDNDGGDDGSGDGDSSEIILELTSPALVNVAAAGEKYIITYKLKNAAEDTVVAIELINEDMFATIDSSLLGSVDVTVAANTTAEARQGVVIIKYKQLKAAVVFDQAAGAQEDDNTEAPEDVVRVDVTAKSLTGSYYADRITSDWGHYWLIFSDIVGATNSDCFRMDILAPFAEDTNNIVIPDGDYRYDPANLFDGYTILNIGNTDYAWIDAYGDAWAMALESASLKVSGNHFELVAEVDGKEYHLTYDGDYDLNYYVLTEWISSLTEDTKIDLSNHSASISNCGDSWNCGCNNWWIEIASNDGWNQGAYVALDFLTESTTDFTGHFVSSGYTVEDPTKPDFRPGVFIPGFRLDDSSNDFMGSVYVGFRDGQAREQAPFATGTMDITANGDGTYTIVVDAYDDAPRPNKVTLSWTGRLSFLL